MTRRAIRDKKLMDQVRQKAWNTRNGVYVPTVAGDVPANWPTCGTCHQDVEAVELKNRNSLGVELWARCHGKEDWYQISFPYSIPDNGGEDKVVNDHIKMAMRAFTPFQSSIAL